MHLLAAQRGSIEEAGEAIDLGQSPADIVFLSAADTELACLAAAHRSSEAGMSLRIANLMRLSHPMSVDQYAEQTAVQSKLIVVRCLGGAAYWQYGLETLHTAAVNQGYEIAVLPGDDKPDLSLDDYSTVSVEHRAALHQYLIEGGVENAASFLAYCAALIDNLEKPAPAAPLPKAGVLPFKGKTNTPKGRALIVFYRALMQSGQTEPVIAMADALAREGLEVTPFYLPSLRDDVAMAMLRSHFERHAPDVILNMTGFAVSSASGNGPSSVLDEADVPVLQIVLSGQSREQWQSGLSGLSAKDLAMNVALPEVDGRILSRAISFKSARFYDENVQSDIVSHAPDLERCAFVAKQAAGWVKLKKAANKDKKIAILLANYPNKDGRLANGVGLDTPAGTVEVLRALLAQNYDVQSMPKNGDDLLTILRAGVTNAGLEGREIRERFSIADYQSAFAQLPEKTQQEIEQRWGKAESDPLFLEDAFALPLTRFGHVVVGVQPARGYNIDPKDSYHSPDLVPPHNYFATYFWLRHHFGADAIIHMGKHGNLEWLPGKALAMSGTCYPELTLGTLPHFYPFIVNDPGEGTQAKRRASAVIIDHLTPPMTRAETYGPLRDLEALVDEYYQASGHDPRRVKHLSKAIADLMETTNLDVDLGLSDAATEDERLEQLDAHLCDLKELQIRDGLHVFGVAPDGRLLNDLVVAIARVPRGTDHKGDASLQRSIADDLALGFDPLTTAMEKEWVGPRPQILVDQSADQWRSNGDTVERIEIFASKLVAGEMPCPNEWTRSQAVMDHINLSLRPALEACGNAEMAGLLAGLDGRFVAPGSSGAPTRGRADVLPTGKNFYSVDTRAVPSETAWVLGKKSAELLVRRYVQDEGDWPKSIALTAWGTANMRTGGDDIAQALALIGAKPIWDGPSRRVTGFEIIPVPVLDRPRVDVTLRISGFFRDAFPDQIALFDRAVRAIGALDEDADDNPLAAQVTEDYTKLISEGLDSRDANRRASFRVFGSKPGAYGAGLQALIDEGGWSEQADLGEAYLVWGSYAYGAGEGGSADRTMFEQRLSGVEAIVQNQDNREHDLLDSDDYYQFEGGMASAVQKLQGTRPVIYHNDHSRPERPVIRTLEEEIARVVRGRCVNPKWIAGVMRHGYKGAFEMAATVDYLFAFSATTGAVRDHHFQMVYDAYLGDDIVRGFIADKNPDALKEMIARFDEAIARGLWTPKSNSARFTLAELQGDENGGENHD